MLEQHLQIVELGDREVGVVYKNERLAGVLAPGTRQLYWRGPVEVRVGSTDITEEFELDAATARVLMRAHHGCGARAGGEHGRSAGYGGGSADRGR